MISHFVTWQIGNDRSGVLVTVGVASRRAGLDAAEAELGMAGMERFPLQRVLPPLFAYNNLGQQHSRP
jgi:hypothetical protein